MAWQNPNQPGWNPGEPPITKPPSIAPLHAGQPGVSMDQVVLPAQYGMPMQPLFQAQPEEPPAQTGPDGYPTSNSNCPPGLENLMTLDRVVVDQKVELLEAITGWETQNKYVVKDDQGQVIYYVAEESDCCDRMCSGRYRAFEMCIRDATMKEVIRLKRPYRGDCCLCPCWLQKIEVFSNGVPLGSIIQNWSLIRPSFSVLDSTGDSVLSLKGPMCCCVFIDFPILSADGEHKVGKISKEWTGWLREIFTDADKFEINFPRDLDVKIKALLLGACFLIDFMYFETDQSC